MSNSKPNKYMAINNMVMDQKMMIQFLTTLRDLDLIDNKMLAEVGYSADALLQKKLLEQYSTPKEET